MPYLHFPRDATTAEVSDGKWDIKGETFEGVDIQILRWWHAEGEQKLRVRGVAASGLEADSYFNTCRENGCLVM